MQTVALSVSNPSLAVDLPLRINCGGAAYESADGTPYLEDTPYDAQLGYGHVGGDVEEFFLPIAGTQRHLLYRSERLGTFAYRVDLPPGTYSAAWFSTRSNTLFLDTPAGSIASGIYYLRLSGPGTAVRRVLFMK